MKVDSRGFWLRWVIANGSAEFVGLTSTLALAAGLFTVNDRFSLAASLLAAAAIALLGGAVEGALVGAAQWSVLRRAIPALPWRPWVAATSIGALVAWLLGMLPSTFLATANAATTQAAQTAAAVEPPLALQLVLAAGMGAVLGPVLGVPQWRVLRRFLPNAGWWVLANVTAWMLGMPAVFLATSLIAPGMQPAVVGAIVALGCLGAGVVVGAVHGGWLVWMLRRAAA